MTQVLDGVIQPLWTDRVGALFGGLFQYTDIYTQGACPIQPWCGEIIASHVVVGGTYVKNQRAVIRIEFKRPLEALDRLIIAFRNREQGAQVAVSDGQLRVYFDAPFEHGLGLLELVPAR